MLPVDFHCHTTFSDCGLHSIMEMLTEAKRRGLAGLAITDHGPAQGGHVNTSFFERLNDPLLGIKLLKGMECNLLDDRGEIDFPKRCLKWADIVLLGIHPNSLRDLGKTKYTDMLCRALEKNRFVDIIAHPNDEQYPVDYFKVARTAAKLGVALEINNSKMFYKRSKPAEVRAILEACRKTGCCIAVNSDAHAINEVGCDESVHPLIKASKFPRELIANASAASAFAFVKERRKNKGQ
jgi:putative hydrolase